MDHYYTNLNSEYNSTMGNKILTEYQIFANITSSEVKVQHVDKLYRIPPILVAILFIAYRTICVSALIGNGLVMCLVLPSKRMWSVTNFLFTNLAFADIFIALFTVPFHFQAALFQRWDIPHFLCLICPFIQELSVSVSVFTLDCHCGSEIRSCDASTTRHLVKIESYFCLDINLGGGDFCSFTTYMDFTVKIYRNRNKPGIISFCKSEYLSPSFKWYYFKCIVCTQYIAPLFIICLAYYKTGTQLWRTETPGNNDQYRDAKILRNKNKVTRMMVIVVLMFAICWLPFQSFLEMHFPRINDYYYINLIWICMHWLAMSNSCVNPFIYAILNEKFKAEFKIRWQRYGGGSSERSDNNVQVSDRENNMIELQNIALLTQPADV